jgi:hypothetical protein
MKKIVMAIVLGVAAAGYGQPYQPEHLLHMCGQPGYHQWFGRKIIGVGDINRDGCDDFVVSVTLNTSPPQGQFAIYFGGSPPDSIPDILFQNPYSDGGFDADARNIGDVNGDGYDDIAVGGNYPSENVGRVFIYYGGNALDTIPDIVLAQGPSDDAFSSNFCGLGDINGDGYGDIAVQAVNYQSGRGKLWIYFGGDPMDTIPDWEKAGTHSYAGYGCFMAGGDLNGDGFSDFVINENSTSNDYSDYQIYFGSTTIDTLYDLLIQGSTYSMGGYIAIIPNLNGDNYADLLISCGNPRGTAVFFGGNPFNLDIDVILQGLSSANAAWRISRAGDVNVDGYDDVIVGQNGDQQVFGGRVLVYFGGAWVSPNPYMVWNGWFQPWEGCGEAICDPGDVNGDGVDDIMFASFNGFNQPGCVDIWLGDSAFVAAVPQEQPATIPQSFRLLPPYPNPFNSSLTIPLELRPEMLGKFNLKIYNVLGQEVIDLKDKLGTTQSTSGFYEVTWDGRDKFGIGIGSGIYFVYSQYGSSIQIRKAVLLQ